MLTKRQKLTIKHLKKDNIITPLQIIEYCVKSLDKPNKTSYTKHPKAPHVSRRHHSKSYFQEIINYYAQNGDRVSLS